MVRELGREGDGLSSHLRPCQEAKQVKTNNVGGMDMLNDNQGIGEIRVSPQLPNGWMENWRERGRSVTASGMW